MLFLLNLFKEKQKQNKVIAKTSPSVPEKKSALETAARKGEIGEYKIDIQLDQLSKEYKYISDMMVENPKAKSGYSQIDHVVISPYGIFVIETKNYQGTVYGGKARKLWSMNGKFKFMNPFIQNYGHVAALKRILDKKYHPLFISIVSFTKRCTFKLDELDFRKIASNELIVYDIELSDFIHRKVSVLKLVNQEPLLSSVEIASIFESLGSNNIKDPSAREQHLKALKEKTAKRFEEADPYSMCVTCGVKVSEKVRTYSMNNKKFNGKIYCFEHQEAYK
ncbi:MAG: nuclease-related domain-containing protein [Bacillota bacterium]